MSTSSDTSTSSSTKERDRALAEAARREAEDHVVAAGVPADMASQPDIPHDIIPGYRITRRLHRGGQGVVYQAIQASTGKKVAIKVIHHGPFADPRNRARLERGVRILSQLNDPRIVTIIDSGVAEGSLYYVMEYIPGYSLDEFVERIRTSTFKERSGSRGGGSSGAGQVSRRPTSESSRQQKADIRSLVHLFIKICEAVSAAHVRGVIHRDLKPGNIRIDEAGEPHILDFDLAKVVAGDRVDEDNLAAMSQTGEFLGSLRWASPEQVERHPSNIDMRTDIYSLGVVLFEMLTGQFPYPVLGSRREVEEQILYSPPQRPSSLRSRIDDDLETVMLTCLSKDRNRRYRTAGALADDLVRYLEGQAILAKPASPWYLLRKMAGRYRFQTAAILSLAITVLASSAISFHFLQESRAAAERSAQDAQRFRNMARESEAVALQAKRQLRRQTLGWFLLEWNADRHEAAHQIRDRASEDTPESRCMHFLLDKSISPESFMNTMRGSAAPLGQFCVGERLLKEKKWSQASRAFNSVVLAPRSDWLRPLAQERLAQIDRLAAKAGVDTPSTHEATTP